MRLHRPAAVSAAAVLAMLTVGSTALPAAAATPSETAYGVTSSGNRLVVFDTANPNAAGQGTPLTGIGAGELVVGMDTRPGRTGSDTFLYVLTDDNSGVGRLYSVNPTTFAATRVGTDANATYSLGGTPNDAKFDIDFNPCVDRIRVVGSNRTNLRVNPDTGVRADNPSDGQLTYASGDANAGSIPRLGGDAYTSATPGSGCTTTVYGADFSLNTLATVGSVNGTPDSPNSGASHTVGGLGNDPTSLLGFDISGPTGTAYLASQQLSSGGVASAQTLLYTVDLATGTATAAARNNGVGTDLLGTFAVGPAAVVSPPPSLPEFPLAGLGLLGAVGVIGTVVLRRRARVSAA